MCLFFIFTSYITYIIPFSYSFFITRFLDSSFFLRYGCLYCFIFLISYILLEYQLFLLVTIDFFQDFLYPESSKKGIRKTICLKGHRKCIKIFIKIHQKVFFLWKILTHLSWTNFPSKPEKNEKKRKKNYFDGV